MVKGPELMSETVTVKPLVWREYPNQFYPDVFGHVWDAETPFGRFTIEETIQSDSPGYEARFGHRFIASKDSLDEAKAASQADFDQCIRSVLG